MANVNGKEYGEVNGSKIVRQPGNKKGRKRIEFFSINTTTQAVANGDTINFVTLPKGARVIGGRVTYGAIGANATLKIGTAADDDRYSGAALDVSAAGGTDLADTQAKFFGEELTDDTLIIGTAGGAAFAAAKDVTGYLEYVID